MGYELRKWRAAHKLELKDSWQRAENGLLLIDLILVGYEPRMFSRVPILSP